MSVSASGARHRGPLFSTEPPTPSTLLSKSRTHSFLDQNQTWKTEHKFPKPETGVSPQIPRGKKGISDVLVINHYYGHWHFNSIG